MVRLATSDVARERFLLALTGAVLVGIAAVPHVVVATGHDTFRLPKELWLRAEGIVIAVMLGLGFAWGWLEKSVLAREKKVFALVAAIVAWTGIATLFSTDRAHSFWSLLYVICAAIVFVATLIAAFRRSLLFADVALIAAVPNAVLCILGELHIFYPFLTPEEVLARGEAQLHLYAGGLLGNPNDIGSFLAGPALAALILCATIPRRRIWYGVLAAVIVAGVLFSQSAAAIGAVSAGLMIVAFRRSWKWSVAMLAVITVIGAVVSAYSFTFQRKVRRAWAIVRGENVTAFAVDAALSNRLMPFLAAGRMAIDHPLLGVGPGRFGWHVYEYKVPIERSYPTLRESETQELSWGQVHNDHLQAMATAGLPAYALYLGAIAMLAWRSRRAPPEGDDLARAANRLSLPFAVMFFVLTLAQFPMEIAAATMMLLHWAALCVAWSSDAAG